jgi:hypothetical protein
MKRLFLSMLVASVAAAPAAAQEDLLGECAAVQVTADPAIPGGVPDGVNTQFRFLCGQVVDALTDVQPTVGIAFSGGAHTLGTSTTIGRRLGIAPRVSLTARFNAALADVPDLLDGFLPAGSADGELQVMGTSGVPVWAFQGDAVVGVFNGLDYGPALGGLGAVDLLGSVSFVPSAREIGLESAIATAGLGARVGILRQGLVVPGISVSAMYRRMLGDVSFGDVAAGDPAEFSSNLSTVSLRGGVSMGLAILDLNAGVGYDIYTSDVAFNWELVCPAGECVAGQDVTLSPAGPVDGQLRTAAWNVHGNAGLNLTVLNLVAEVGYQKATDIVDGAAMGDAGLPGVDPTGEALSGGRVFASVGLRLTL